MRIFFALFSFIAFVQKASAYVELNGFYFNDSLTVGTAASANRLFIEGSLGFAVDSHKKYNIGWNYSTQSTSDVANGKTATYSSSQMGPRFLIFLDRNNAWSLGFGYYLVSKASYDDGNGNSATWKGTAYKVDIGYNFPVTESLLAGIRMNYSGASYSEQIVGSTTYSNVSYTRSIIYPSLYAVYIF
jgi:hypothetical protein